MINRQVNDTNEKITQFNVEKFFDDKHSLDHLIGSRSRSLIFLSRCNITVKVNSKSVNFLDRNFSVILDGIEH